MEQAAGYLRVMRPDKVIKFYKECVKELEAKGLGESYTKLGADFIAI
jgi:hypothetical protein